jgi:hypothetical protein
VTSGGRQRTPAQYKTSADIDVDQLTRRVSVYRMSAGKRQLALRDGGILPLPNKSAVARAVRR